MQPGLGIQLEASGNEKQQPVSHQQMKNKNRFCIPHHTPTRSGRTHGFVFSSRPDPPHLPQLITLLACKMSGPSRRTGTDPINNRPRKSEISIRWWWRRTAQTSDAMGHKPPSSNILSRVYQYVSRVTEIMCRLVIRKFIRCPGSQSVQTKILWRILILLLSIILFRMYIAYLCAY